MEFINRLKGQLTESIVKALFEDAKYRVIPSGVEHLIRETACMSKHGYRNLKLSESIKKLPDFIVLDKAQEQYFPIEVKYRKRWDQTILTNPYPDIKGQVELLGEMVLIVSIGEPELKPGFKPSGATYLRALPLRIKNGEYQACVFKVFEDGKDKEQRWIDIQTETIDWWYLFPLQFFFLGMASLLNPDDTELNEKTLLASNAIAAIRDDRTWKIRFPNLHESIE